MPEPVRGNEHMSTDEAITNISAGIETTTLPLSCVLPVYHAVSPAEFIRAFMSLVNQTMPADELIVILDGPVDSRIEEFLDAQDPRTVTVVRFPENRGIAAAMEDGFNIARNRWIARHDSDDIALPRRFELQWPVVATGKYAAVGGAMLEFDADPHSIIRVRSLPGSPRAIARYVRMNSPLNNQSTIFDREAVRAVGGTHDLARLEDYDLFARLIAYGYQLCSIPDPLVLVHASEDMYVRRTDRQLFASEWRLQQNLVTYGLIPAWRAPLNYAARQTFRMLPVPLLKAAYRLLFDRGDPSLKVMALEWTDQAPSGASVDARARHDTYPHANGPASA